MFAGGMLRASLSGLSTTARSAALQPSVVSLRKAEGRHVLRQHHLQIIGTFNVTTTRRFADAWPPDSFESAAGAARVTIPKPDPSKAQDAGNIRHPEAQHVFLSSRNPQMQYQI